eukprot:TRINITY_DN26171_c0_g1_i1.p1 TRINITY_DN26171_c0_g1~~TRINITY_DN26171_c0_g1_i1.p1  ORF type:complete len:145 (+),score=0.38 TRINITY_DN26171_c0_g1_i1:55-435(+)
MSSTTCPRSPASHKRSCIEFASAGKYALSSRRVLPQYWRAFVQGAAMVASSSWPRELSSSEWLRCELKDEKLWWSDSGPCHHRYLNVATAHMKSNPPRLPLHCLLLNPGALLRRKSSMQPVQPYPR